ncbi:hypothetical protein [Legionella sp. PC997]|uniref:hypothetical protein n=1 Tax=Legionella sp. PC997 TaxID=2755562 RepID=UPI0015F7ADDC|nr:hypothetical protein [Legionella sp. PC997]QMT60870.1 hypothetical protein HBNCFIEN_02258 [Legionella sp. PC997]
MGFYFNTYRQQEGDKAYNEGRYEDALVHYSEALKTLQLHAAAQTTRHADFYDALVYVLSEILSTKLLIIQREALASNFVAVSNYWQDLPGLLHEMELTHNEHLKKNRNAFSNQEDVVKRVNILAATVCEKVSDELADQLEDDEEVTLESISPSIEWMKRAIQFQIKTESTPKLSSSLGYLNLLERLYKKTQDGNYLQVISEYINQHKLLERTIRSPLRKLELLSYVARVALFNRQNTDGLISECKALYDLVPKEERDNPILEDLQNLLDIVPQEEEQEENELEDDVPDAMETNTSDLEDLGEYPQSIQLDRIDVSTCPVDMLLALENSCPEPTGIPSLPSPANTVTSDQEMTQSHSISQSFSSRVFDGIPTQTFFSPPPQVQAEDELPHSRALQLGLEKITAHSRDPRFLANLLCLIADFFNKNKAHYIQKQNAIVLAHDLYKQVFKIDPHHHRAIEKLRNIGIQHSRLINSYRHFSNAPQSPIPSAAINITEAKNSFNQALEELTIQLESFLLNQPAKVRITIDELVCFIGEQLTKGVITSKPRPEIGQMLTNTFEEELRNSVRSDHSLGNI